MFGVLMWILTEIMLDSRKVGDVFLMHERVGSRMMLATRNIGVII